MIAKPPYYVPTMAEIQKIPWNGFNSVSTFSGCGGSSTGYRLAGYRMLWASEFIPAAQETYRANCAPYTLLDTRDIREVTGADLLSAVGLGVGDIDLFDGSPPCASFSTNGNREKDWGKVKKYSDTTQRTDDLFFEYSRLIRETQPRVFIAENVAGLVRGSAKGYFKMILSDLKACGYRVTARVCQSAWLGVPQTRNRIIFIGVRNDLAMDPVFPKPLPYQYSVRDVLPNLALQGDNGGFISGGAMRSTEYPSPTIQTGPSHGNGTYPPGYVIPFRVLHDTGGTLPTMSKGDVSDRTAPPVTAGNSNHFAVATENPLLTDPETGAQLSLAGSAAGRAIVKGLKPGNWAEPRKLTLVELRAICGFPPDFVLTGSYAQRWERIGRAVPPVMMSHIAATVRDEILVPLRDAGTI
jgi:DNA (cytosine-5)-methyltransferase 1